MLKHFLKCWFVKPSHLIFDFSSSTYFKDIVEEFHLSDLRVRVRVCVRAQDAELHIKKPLCLAINLGV